MNIPEPARPIQHSSNPHRVAIIQSETRIIGGIERVTETLLRFTGWQDLELYVVFLRPGMLVDAVRQWFPAERILVCDAGRIRQIHRAAWTIGRIVRKLRQWQIGTVVSQGIHSQCYGGISARLAGIGNAFWCHGVLNEDDLDDRLVRLALRAPKEIIVANSEATLASLRAVVPGVRQRVVIYPGIHFRQDGASGGDFRREFHIPPEAQVVTLIARLQESKGQRTFLHAAALVLKSLPATFFTIVGSPTFAAERAYELELRQLAEQLGIRNRIVFTGHREDVSSILQQSDLAVHATLGTEGFGLTLVEAMAAGKPVIATDTGGPAEVVKNGITGIVIPPGDAEKLGKWICALLTNPEMRSAMGDAGRQRAYANFSDAQMAAGLEAAIGRTGLS